jgi:DNA polymerase-4
MIMHIDINSCFATIEQQANPFLRGKPVVVAASVKDFGCILASSTEAKRKGVKTGMRVKEGKQIEPNLIVLPCDPDKYRFIHHQLKQLLSVYTPDITPKSIDEFSLKFDRDDLTSIAQEIKQRIRTEIGEHISVSIGIGTNRFLAKTAAGIHKPDGLDVITMDNIQTVFKKLELTDLCGISFRNALRLNQVDIHSALDFFNASPMQLKAAFKSITATYWYMRLHGIEIDDAPTHRRGLSNSYVLPHPTPPIAAFPIMIKLTHKLTERLRKEGYQTDFLILALSSGEHHHWHKGIRLTESTNKAKTIIHEFHRLMNKNPFQEIKKITVFCGDLKSDAGLQLNLFQDEQEHQRVDNAVDTINHRFGLFTLVPAPMMNTKDYVPDAIAFGKM